VSGLLCQVLPPWCVSLPWDNGRAGREQDKWAWTKTSETMSQNKIFPPLN
jgi:hypothetical protein